MRTDCDALVTRIGCLMTSNFLGSPIGGWRQELDYLGWRELLCLLKIC